MKYGLIGEKLGHSFSKAIHERLGLEYELCEIAPDALDAFMREKNFLGISVTIPYKSAVIPYLDEIDEAAKSIGAVNTIVNRGGRLYGYNTDYYGMMDAIKREYIYTKDRKVAILGSGATSKTAKAVFEALEAGEILTVSRGEKEGCITYDQLLSQHIDTEIIVNTTPVGTYPDSYGAPVELMVFDNLSAIVDVVYNPLNTAMAQEARLGGVKVASGLYMLVSQAVHAAELFLDKKIEAETIDRIYEEVYKEKENIVLIGMPSCGKTTVGKIIAERMGRKFIDTDSIIEMRAGMTISDFFKKYGESKFRELESEVILEAAKETGAVIATGGGAALCKANRIALEYSGKLYYIDRSVENLVATKDRPLSRSREALEALYNERFMDYGSVCWLRINGDRTPDEVAEDIMEYYR